MGERLVPISAVCHKDGNVTIDTVNGGTECVSIVNFTVDNLGNFVNEVVDQDVNVGGARSNPTNDVYLNQQK